MTTITREQAQKIIDAADNVITALAGTNDDFHPDNSEKMCGLWDDLNDRYAPPEVVRELARAMLASMDAEPAGYHVIKECGKIGCSVATLEKAEKTRDFWNKKWTIRPYFYTAPPVQETGVYKDMLNIIGLLENNEWAEHCTSTVLGSLLESEITRLVGKEQPVPIVPDGYCIMPVALTAKNGAKWALSGEFSTAREVTCPECEGDGCSDCDGRGDWYEDQSIDWTTIKEIYRRAVEVCALPTGQTQDKIA
ncbi:TPA: hypothetical protein ACJG6B_004816 [Salmonella enterica subsp. enterica serovar Enteritidis]